MRSMVAMICGCATAKPRRTAAHSDLDSERAMMRLGRRVASSTSERDGKAKSA
jgi:hypothetical protein